jgi:hypothetical protein
MPKELARLQWEAELIKTIGVVELTCAVLYLIPQTSVLGAILLTGYLGGATATHVRIHDAFIGPVVFGVIVWLGLYFRDARIRALMPFNRRDSSVVFEESLTISRTINQSAKQ